MGDIRYVDYEAEYKEIDDCLRKDECYGRVEKCRASGGGDDETMVVRSMYLRLDDIDARHVVRPERVETLMVYADVVDVESEWVELPGTKQVFILCRLMRLKARGGRTTLDFKYMIATEPQVFHSALIPPQQLIVASSTSCTSTGAARREGGLVTRMSFRVQVLEKQVDVLRTCHFNPYTDATSLKVTVQTLKTPGFTYMSDESDFQAALTRLRVLDRREDHLMSELFCNNVHFLLRTSLSSLQNALPKICVIPPAACLHLEWFTHPCTALITLIRDQHLLEKKDLVTITKKLKKTRASTIFELIRMGEVAFTKLVWKGLIGDKHKGDLKVIFEKMHNLHRILKIEHTRTIGEVANYDEVFNSMKQITELVVTTECSEVMVMQQMYLLLDDLNVGLLQNPQNVKKLVVFADVIEIGSQNLQIPGSTKVTIICRILRTKRTKKITFPYLYESSSPLSVYVSPFGLLQQDSTSKVCIYAKKLIMNDPFNPLRVYSTSVELLNLVEVLDDPYVLPLIVDSLQSVYYILTYHKSTTIIATTTQDHLQWLISLLNQLFAKSGNKIIGFWRQWAEDLSKHIKDVTQHTLSTSEVVDYAEVYKSVNADYAEVYKSANQMRRVVATRVREYPEVVTMHRMYFVLEELNASLFKNPDAVKEVYVYADVVELGSQNLQIPGLTKIIIICRLLRVKGPHKLTFPYLSHDRDLSPLSLFVSTVKLFDWPSTLGVCIYAQHVIMNNLFNPTICSSTSFQLSIPVELLGNPNVLPLIEADLQSAELILTYQTNVTATVTATRDHLKWLITLLNEVKDDTNLNEVSFPDLLNHAQSILRKSNGSTILLVPSLRYDKYSDLIKTMANAASAYDSEFKQLDLFNKQIQIAGDYLWVQNKKLAEKERDVALFHSSLLEHKKKELNAANENSEKLKEQLESLKTDMMKARQDLDAGLKKYKDKLKMKALLSGVFLVINLALVFTTFTTCGANIINGYKEIQESQQDCKEIKQILKETWEVIKPLQELALCRYERKLHDAFDMPKLPSKAEWYKFENEIVAMVEILPSTVSEVFMWKAKCKNVSVVSRELITTMAYIRRLEHEIWVEDREVEVATKQAERLEKMKVVGLKNYEEMALQLDMRNMRILTHLLRVLNLQNGALLYHYLLQPRPIGERWMNMGEVTSALRSHKELEVEGLEQMGTPTDKESVYKVGNIPVALLMTGQDWIFTIPTHDFSSFPRSWSHVRIKYVEIRFSPTHPIPSTTSGHVYFLLQASRMFQDRKKGAVLDYETSIPLEYQFAYHLNSGKTTESNKPTHEYEGSFMRMTPFTQWRLRLSTSAQENQGLSFPTANEPDSTTEVSITFYLTAIREKST